MNFTAQKASRKWACDAFGRIGRAMVTATAACLLLGMPADAAYAAKGFRAPWDGLFREAPRRSKARVHRAAVVVPLPKPRPAEAPSSEHEKPAAGERKAHEAGKEGGKDNGKPAEQAAPATPPAPQPSACRLALTDAIAVAPSIPDIHGTGGCGGEDLVRLEAIVLPDKRHVAVKPAAILRCKMATALVDWIRNDIAPLAAGLGSTVSDLNNLDSFECRGRNGVAGAQLSEHGRANALDVHDFRLANGRMISLTDRTVPRELRETVLHSACTRFSTVLGPGSDGYHEDHIHLDLLERRNNYRICQWDVLDPLPPKAPLLPAERPEEAPPRQVAKSDTKPDGKSDTKSDTKSDAKSDAKSDYGTPAAEKSEEAEPEPEAKPAATKPAKPATKKRRHSRRS